MSSLERGDDHHIPSWDPMVKSAQRNPIAQGHRAFTLYYEALAVNLSYVLLSTLQEEALATTHL